MKCRLYLIAGIGFLLSSSLTAQDDGRRENLEFGTKAAINISNVWDANNNDFTSHAKVGFAGGVFIGIPIGRFIGIQPEVPIPQKGFKGSGSSLGEPYSTTRTTTFLDIPLQIQLKPTDFITVLSGGATWDLQNNKGDETSSTPRYKNQWLQFTTGYIL